MEISKFLKNYKKYYIFLRRKDLQAGIEHAVYVNGAENIEVIENLDKINDESFLQTDNSQIDYLISNKDKIKNCFIYLLLRNCYADYVSNKKKIIFLKKYIKKLYIINHFSYNRENFFYPASKILKINKSLSETKIKGLKFKEKIKICYPNIFTILKILKNLNLAIQLLSNTYLIFCGKYFFTKEQNKETVKSSKFSKKTKKYLDRLDKYKKIQNIKIVNEDLNILKKIMHEKRTNYYEIFYLIQCFSRTLIFNHLRKFDCCKLFYKPTLNLIRTKIFKKIIQIDVNSLVTPGLAIDRHWNLKKNYYQNSLSLLLFDKNYLHNKKNFSKKIEVMIKFLIYLYRINDYSTNALKLKKKLEFYFKKKDKR